MWQDYIGNCVTKYYKKRGDLDLKKTVIYIMSCVSAIAFVLSVVWGYNPTDIESAYSRLGSQGKEVAAIQQTLKEWGLFNDDVTGYYGTVTQAAVKKFQKIKGLEQTGIADSATLAALGISVGSIPAATEANIKLLAQIISAEARGEPYEGQVAVGAVILNRIEHPSFPDTLAGVIYQKGAFTAIDDGQFWEPISSSAYDAARDALNGWDPTGGAIYYYNSKKTSNSFIISRPVIVEIGDHLFCS